MATAIRQSTTGTSRSFEGFTDSSAIRRVNGESVLLLGGGRALLMQLAHPLVAAGVAEHSSFRTDRLGRLLRTVRPMYSMAFGTSEEACAAATAIARSHAGVSGAGYRASDPELQLWVWATLVDSALVTYERFVAPMPEALIDEYIHDSVQVGILLGIPPDVLPRNAREFADYVAGMTATLEVTDLARGLAIELFSPEPWGAAPVYHVLRRLTAVLLPPGLRGQFGLACGRLDEAGLEVITAGSRLVWPRLPSALRRPPRLVMPASPTRRGH